MCWHRAIGKCRIKYAVPWKLCSTTRKLLKRLLAIWNQKSDYLEKPRRHVFLLLLLMLQFFCKLSHSCCQLLAKIDTPFAIWCCNGVVVNVWCCRELLSRHHHHHRQSPRWRVPRSRKTCTVPCHGELLKGLLAMRQHATSIRYLINPSTQFYHSFEPVWSELHTENLHWHAMTTILLPPRRISRPNKAPDVARAKRTRGLVKSHALKQPSL